MQLGLACGRRLYGRTTTNTTTDIVLSGECATQRLSVDKIKQTKNDNMKKKKRK